MTRLHGCGMTFLGILASLLVWDDSTAQHRDLPEDFQQILPRGRIAAITDPSYVPASEADVDPDSWVLGVVIEGQPRAYSLNLLNAHEVVNDRIAQTSFAAVW